MKLRSLLFAGTGLAAMLDFPTASVAAGMSDFSLEEIVVTARRKEEKIQEVPVAVTAITGGDLREQRVFRQEDLQYMTPGLSVNQVTVQNNLTYNLRGQGQAFGGSAPGVQTYFDEVPLLGGVFQYYDVDRIEVLRGPQGTLFGRNTTGGAVRVIPKRPSLKSFEGYTEASTGNLNAQSAEGAINVPIGDKLAVRLAGNYTARDGYVQNVTTNQDLDNLNNHSFRLGVLWQPTENLENVFTMNTYRSTNNGSSYVLSAVSPAVPSILTPLLTATFAQQSASDFTRTTSDLKSFSKLQVDTFENITSYNFGPVTLKNIAGLTKNDGQQNIDFDATALPLFQVTYVDNQFPNKIYTDELQLLGDSFDGHLSWLVGGYYENVKAHQQNVFVDAASGAPPPFPAFVTLVSATKPQGESQAAFGQGTYNIDSVKGLSLVAGYRYTMDHRTGQTSVANTVVPRGTPNPLIPTLGPEQAADFAASTYTAGVNYQLNNDVLLYVASRKGYKAGGFNANGNSAGATGVAFKFDPEGIKDVELGAKAQWRTSDSLNGQVNVATFTSKLDHFQRTGSEQVAGRGVSYTFNGGEATIKGIELEALTNVFENFELGFIYSYTDAQFDKYFDPVQNLDVLAANGGKIDFAYTPKTKMTLSARYRLPLGENLGEPSVGVTYFRQSATALAEPSGLNAGATASAPIIPVQDAVGLLNASVDWRDVLGKPIDVSLFGKNLSDKRYFTGTAALNFASVNVAEPRTYGLQLRYRFGDK